MSGESIRVLEKLRDLLSSNIDDVYYNVVDHETSKLNNITTGNPESLFNQSKIPAFGVYEKSTITTGFKPYKSTTLYQNDDDSWVVWTVNGATSSIIVIAVMSDKEDYVIDKAQEINSFLIDTQVFNLFTLADDYIDVIADIQVQKIDNVPGGYYPYRRDVIIRVNYLTYKEENLFTADDIEIEFEAVFNPLEVTEEDEIEVDGVITDIDNNTFRINITERI